MRGVEGGEENREVADGDEETGEESQKIEKRGFLKSTPQWLI